MQQNLFGGEDKLKCFSKGELTDRLEGAIKNTCEEADKDLLAGKTIHLNIDGITFSTMTLSGNEIIERKI